MKTSSIFKAIAAILLISASLFSCSKDKTESASEGKGYAGQYGIFINTNETLDPLSYETVVREYMENAINETFKDLTDVFRNSSNDMKAITACDLVYENIELKSANPGKSFTVILFFKEDDEDSARQAVKRYDYLGNQD